MKLKDGWHLLPGDGVGETPGMRFSYDDSARYYWYAGVFRGNVLGVSGKMSLDEPLYSPLDSQFVPGFVDKIEKSWGKSIEELLCPSSELSWGKAVALAFAGLAGVGLAGGFRKRTTKTAKQQQTAKHEVVSK